MPFIHCFSGLLFRKNKKKRMTDQRKNDLKKLGAEDLEVRRDDLKNDGHLEDGRDDLRVCDGDLEIGGDDLNIDNDMEVGGADPKIYCDLKVGGDNLKFDCDLVVGGDDMRINDDLKSREDNQIIEAHEKVVDQKIKGDLKVGRDDLNINGDLDIDGGDHKIDGDLEIGGDDPKINGGLGVEMEEPILSGLVIDQGISSKVESSPLDWVNEWVNSLRNEMDCTVDVEGQDPDSDSSEQSNTSRRVTANKIVHTRLAAASAFTGLRVANLSGSSIVRIGPGVLPKSLQSLDLSRNNMTAIEGLRGLTRLRILNLSCNKISRIGHGLGNCILIKELYLAKNKISDLEGLHRLLKLQVLDLSFNRLTTVKSLGQLVANYQSLLSLNLLGNPVVVNVGVDHLRKAVSGLLPRLAHLNSQPIKSIRGRDGAHIPVLALGRAETGPRLKHSRKARPGQAQLASRARRCRPKPPASTSRR